MFNKKKNKIVVYIGNLRPDLSHDKLIKELSYWEKYYGEKFPEQDIVCMSSGTSHTYINQIIR